MDKHIQLLLKKIISMLEGEEDDYEDYTYSRKEVIAYIKGILEQELK